MTRYALNQIRVAWGDPQSRGAESSTHDGPFQIPEHIDQGDRHTTLYRFLRSQKAQRISKEVAIAGCHAMNEHQCEQPLEKKELDAHLRRAWEQSDSPDFKGATSQTAGPERFDDVPPEGEPKRRLVTTLGSDVKKVLHKSLFNGRLTQGSFSLVSGPGEAGKGLFLCDLGARCTTGEPFPGERKRREPLKVVVLVTEARGGPRNSDSLLRWDPDPGEGVWHATEETELSG